MGKKRSVWFIHLVITWPGAMGSSWEQLWAPVTCTMKTINAEGRMCWWERACWMVEGLLESTGKVTPQTCSVRMRQGVYGGLYMEDSCRYCTGMRCWHVAHMSRRKRFHSIKNDSAYTDGWFLPEAPYSHMTDKWICTIVASKKICVNK